MAICIVSMMRRGMLVLLIVGVPLTASPQTDPVSRRPLHEPGQPPTDKKLFTRLSPAETGVELVHHFPADAPFALMADQGAGIGVCAGDIDDDGWPDLFVTGYNQGNRLYRNLGGCRFEDITDEAGVAAKGRWCGGALFVDVDDDGDLDLHVSVYGAANAMYLNDGHGRFRDVADQCGLAHVGASVMMSFADYDRDGDMDGYLVTHRENTRPDASLPQSMDDARRRGILQFGRNPRVRIAPKYQEMFELLDKGGGRMELAIAGQQDYLFRNDKGRFQVVNELAGIQGFALGLAATWWDYNQDGFPDLYVSNDYKGYDRLYRNNRDGTFTDSARSALPHIPWYSMGTDLADINNDGLVDFLATDMSGTDHFKRKVSMGDMRDTWFLTASNPAQYMRNAVYLNTGADRLLEVAYLTGLANTDWTWSPKFGDFDLDGYVDLFVSNGMTRDFMNSDIAERTGDRGARWRDKPILKQTNLAFRNLGDLQFQRSEETWGLDQVSASFGTCLVDLDRDGDLDIIVTNFEEPISIYRNEARSGHRLLVRLIGTASNSWGIGAKVRVRTRYGTLTRELTSSQGFMSANEPLVHFGLGDHDQIDRLEIDWPSGRHQVLSKLDANYWYTVREPAIQADPKSGDPPANTANPWFQSDRSLPSREHRERDYNDYALQPLLPWKLSQLGPGLAVGDINTDGQDDFYVGGGAGQSGTLLRSGPAGYQADDRPFSDQAESEDLGALFFDADQDGDDDLYVVSGGVEHPIGAPHLLDRLYLNSKDGQFTLAHEALPDTGKSGSCVAAADFDRDGDLDLFVGGRVLPGEYPLPASSYLLVNEGGKFLDATEKQAGALANIGLVTGALWTDVDNDGWIDLMLTLEWGPVQLLWNRKGNLTPSAAAGSASARLAAESGWWNGIAGRDLDGDQDIDYVVTNVGLNTKYHASAGRPALVYFGDFDGRGKKQLVEAGYEGDILYPERGRSCSTAAMPLLAERFTSFQQFASATLEEIYTPECLEQADRFAATNFYSGVLINDGKGVFDFRPLPRVAQTSPSYGVVLADFNGDGKADLFLAQNNFSPQPETGRMDGGIGLLLTGRGDGTFTPVGPTVSGIVIPHDAKAAALCHVGEDLSADLLVSTNNGPLQLFLGSPAHSHRCLAVQLQGRAGNPHAIGARVTVHLLDGSTQTGEVSAGSGYLSQSTSRLTFGLPDQQSVTRIEVRWPDGSSTSHAANEHRLVVIRQPR